VRPPGLVEDVHAGAAAVDRPNVVGLDCLLTIEQGCDVTASLVRLEHVTSMARQPALK
jgi:hypothetical protein